MAVFILLFSFFDDFAGSSNNSAYKGVSLGTITGKNDLRCYVFLVPCYEYYKSLDLSIYL